MKKFRYLFLFAVALIFSQCEDALPQSPAQIKLRCQTPYSSIYGSVSLKASGDIYYNPCPTKSNFFYGIVDFSNATVILPSGGSPVSGTGTTNFIPRWTNGAAGVIGNTPFSWDGTTYSFKNTALTATWLMSFKPSVAGNGTFTVGNTAAGLAYLNLDELSQQFTATARGGVAMDSGMFATSIGDIVGVGNSTIWTLDDATQSVSVTTGTTFKANKINPLTAAGGAIGRTSLPFTSVFIGNAAENTTQLTGTFTGNRVATFPDATGTVQLVGAANTGTILTIQLANSVLANATGTIFTSPCTSLALAGTTEGNVSCPVTRSGTVRNLYVRTGGTAKVNTPTTVITMRKNGVNQTVLLTMTETVNTTTSDTTHSFTVAAGDLVTLSVSVAGAAAVSTSISGISFEID